MLTTPPVLSRFVLLVLVPVFVVTGCGESTPPEGAREVPGAVATGTEAERTGVARVRWVRADPPAAAGAMAPRLSAASGDGIWASWLEPVEGDTGHDGATVHRLRIARFDGEAWSGPETVATARPEHPFFANWADTPSVVEGAGGELLAHWLAKTGEATYAYAIFLARSTDGGTTWRELGTLHDDDTPTEHGFVSLLPDPGGGFRAFWLDGRAMLDGAPMALRTARVDEGVVSGSTVLDHRVCECCQTSAALTTTGPLVVYRDRSPEEVRDVHAVRAGGTRDPEGGDPGGPGGGGAGDWSDPAPVHRDGWVIPGCPVNGPAVAANGEHVVVAWFTAADGIPRVRAALSRDGGVTFGGAITLDGPEAATAHDGGAEEGPADRAGDAEARRATPPPLGRVDVELLADGTAIVSWLGGDGAVRLRRLSTDGTTGPTAAVAATSTARASGFPRIQPMGDGRRLGVSWVDPETEGGSRLRFATLTVAAAAPARPSDDPGGPGADPEPPS